MSRRRFAGRTGPLDAESAKKTQRWLLFALGGIALVNAVLVLRVHVSPPLRALLGLASVFAFLALAVRRLRSRPAEVVLDESEIHVRSAGHGRTLRLEGAELRVAKWVVPVAGTLGSAIVLTNGAESLRLGAREVLESERYDVEPSDRLDVLLEPGDFQQLLGSLEAKVGAPPSSVDEPGYRDALSHGHRVSIELAANPGSRVHSGRSTLVWIGSMLLAGAIANLLPRVGLSPALAGTAALAVVLAGVFFMLRAAQRSPKQLRLVVSGDDVELLEPASGRTLERARLTDLALERRRAGVANRSGSVPVLEIGFPRRLLRVGAAEVAHAWPDDPPKGPHADYWVGGPEWPRLLQTLGLR